MVGNPHPNRDTLSIKVKNIFMCVQICLLSHIKINLSISKYRKHKIAKFPRILKLEVGCALLKKKDFGTRSHRST